MWFRFRQTTSPIEPMRVRRSGGQSLVEFALLVPIIFVLLLGLIDGARAILLYNTVSNAAREGARFGVILSAPAWGDTTFSRACNSAGTYDTAQITSCMASANEDTIVHHVMSRSAALNPVNTEVRVVLEDPLRSIQGWPAFVRVIVTYRFVPVVLDALGLSGPEITLVGASEMIIE